jgi:hypothetical protein
LAFLVIYSIDTLLTLDNFKQCPKQVQDDRTVTAGALIIRRLVRELLLGYTMGMATGMDIFTEIFIGLLIVRLSCTVNMSFTRKCRLSMGFSFRLPLIALSAIHLAYFGKNLTSPDPQFAVTNSLLFN